MTETPWKTVDMTEWDHEWIPARHGIVDWKHVGQHLLLRLRCGGTSAEHRITGGAKFTLAQKRSVFIQEVRRLVRQMKQAGAYGVT